MPNAGVHPRPVTKPRGRRVQRPVGRRYCPGGRLSTPAGSNRAGPSPIFTTFVTNVRLASPTRAVTSQHPAVEKITYVA
jgi:hypothetical protein